MEMPTISVIMPVYNAHLYVAKAIESVLQQTYCDFELILVDDGATDGSAKICEDYASRDSRIVLIHEENGGICKARNTGLQVARGTYVAFCDHDDFYMPQYLEKAVNTALKNNAKLVKFAYRSEHSENGKITNIFEEPIPNIKLKVEDIFKVGYDLLDLTRRALWNGLYERKIISDCHLTFDESLRAGMEDFFFNIDYLSRVDEVVYISDQLFIHYCRTEQSTFEKYSFDRLGDIVRAKQKEIEFILSKGGAIPAIIVGQEFKYLSLLRREFGLPGCSLNIHEKKEWLKTLRKADNGLNNLKILAEVLRFAQKWKGMTIQELLYIFKWYSILLWFWKVRNS